MAGPDAVDDIRRMPEGGQPQPQGHLDILHAAALREGRAWLDALLTGLDEPAALADLLAEHLPAVGYVPPQGTYLAWLNCAPTDLGDDPLPEPGSTTTVTGPAAVFLERGRVALTTGAAFGTGRYGHVRLNFATPRTCSARRCGEWHPRWTPTMASLLVR